MTAENIDQVISQLDDIIATARREKSRAGYFAALYRKVTVKVKEGIAAGRFEDGPRLEKLDVIFANRYLNAWEQFRRGQPPSQCWRYSFETAASGQALILQHLLLGMNAHINLDLGVAAAQACPGEEHPALKRDFEEINNVLASLMDEVQREIGVVSPLFGWMDWVAGHSDEAICNFSMTKARNAAWKVSVGLAAMTPSQQAAEIAQLDTVIAALSRIIYNRRMIFHPVFQIIRWAEIRDAVKVIDALGSDRPI
ncbi:MAG: hypothetical protein HYZ49_12555 [Chloroflexi bacterium]|nr:hypothetical protein [Chloroflexota bacterium]